VYDIQDGTDAETAEASGLECYNYEVICLEKNIAGI